MTLKKYLAQGPIPASIFSILLLALALRTLALLRTDPVAFDSAVYFEMADLMRAGRWVDALAYPYPPLFPLLVAGLQWFRASAETAGLLVSLVSGLLVLLPLLAVARAAAGAAAWGAVFLWAIHPYAVGLGVRALTDAPTALFVALALWAGLRALQKRTIVWALGAGVASGLAYLTRPEGIEPALALSSLYALRWDTAARRHDGETSTRISPGLAPRITRRIGWVMAPLIGWAIVASPYIAHISVEAGSITFSKKKSVAVMSRSLTMSAPKGHPAARQAFLPDSDQSMDAAQKPRPWLLRMTRNVYIFQQPLVNGIHPLFLFFGLLGVWTIRSQKAVGNANARVLLVGLTGLHLIVLLAVAAATGPAYLGGHHFFLLVLYILPFSGVGLASTLDWIRERMPAFSWAPALAAILMIAPAIWKVVLRAPGRGSVIRPAAAWVREQTQEPLTIVTNVAKLTYHARAERVGLHGNYDEVIQTARTHGAQFIAFYPEMSAKFYSDLQAHLDSGDIELAAEFTKQSGKRVYRFLICRLRPLGITSDTIKR